MAMDAGTSVHHTPQGMMRVPDPQAVPYVSIHPEHTPYHKIVTEGSEHQGASPGSVSSPREASIQHHFPVSIDKELLFLNCALSEAFAVSECRGKRNTFSHICVVPYLHSTLCYHGNRIMTLTFYYDA
jgi:hypothetical protein